MMEIAERIEALERAREINSLYNLYSALVDSGKSKRIASEFYAENVIADYHGIMITGREAINSFYVSGMDEFARTAHCLSNLDIHEADCYTAKVVSILTAFHWNGAKSEASVSRPQVEDFCLIVRSEDRLIKTAQGWRVVHRRARAMGPAFAISRAGPDLWRGD